MKVILTESQLKLIIGESFDDYKISAPRYKSISKISSSLNKSSDMGQPSNKKTSSIEKKPISDEEKQRNKEVSKKYTEINKLGKKVEKLSTQIKQYKDAIEKGQRLSVDAIVNGRLGSTLLTKAEMKKELKDFINQRRKLWDEIELLDKS